MSSIDLEVFLQERISSWDPSVDTAKGSPVHTQVIQPVLDRIGLDPFSVDAATFIYSRLEQEHPEIALGKGDATTDLLVKTMLLLWEPIIREVKRIRDNLSFSRPDQLTLEEAEALGANFFTDRDKGTYAKGVVRAYFSQPQTVVVTRASYFSSGAGDKFFPKRPQSFSKEDVAYQTEGGLFYVDIEVESQEPGEEYNLEPGSITQVSNLLGCARVTNKNRFRGGLAAQDVYEYVAAISQNISERSSVTARGARARLTSFLPEITGIQVIGFNDPEMQRDILQGSGKGEILAKGEKLESSVSAGWGLNTDEVTTSEVDFTAYIEPREASKYGLTLYLPGEGLKDFAVKEMLGPNTLRLGGEVPKGLTDVAWALRRSELTLSKIPGGIIFPDTSEGVLTVDNSSVHIGGCTDTYIKGNVLDSGTLTITGASDEEPLLVGDEIRASAEYFWVPSFSGAAIGPASELRAKLQDIAKRRCSIRILQGVNAGVYELLWVRFTYLEPVRFYVRPAPKNSPISSRWEILDTLQVDLNEPKDVKARGEDGSVVFGEDTFTTASLLDFAWLGAGVGDTLRIHTGEGKGDYEIKEFLDANRRLRLGRAFELSENNLKYSLFQKSAPSGVQNPVIRFRSVELLGLDGTPTGAVIPYGGCVGSELIQVGNPSGYKVRTDGAVLGLVTRGLLPGRRYNLNGHVLRFRILVSVPVSPAYHTGSAAFEIAVVLNQDTPEEVSAKVNAAVAAKVAPLVLEKASVVLEQGPWKAVGFNPYFWVFDSTVPDSLYRELFGCDKTYCSVGAVRSNLSVAPGDLAIPDWGKKKVVPHKDVVQVLRGALSGNYLIGSVGSGQDAWALTTTARFYPSVDQPIVVGEKTQGVVRNYFMGPVTFEAGKDAVWEGENVQGTRVSFGVDDTGEVRLVPDRMSKQMAWGNVEQMGGEIQVTDPSHNFSHRGVRRGDILEIRFQSLLGSTTHSEVIPGLEGKQLTLSFGGGAPKTMEFLGDTEVPGEVTRQGVVDQIHTWTGVRFCSWEGPDAAKRLRMELDERLVIYADPTGANAILGFDPDNDTVNDAPDAGRYNIFSAENSQLLADKLASVGGLQSYRIFRQGGFRISSTEMGQNKTDEGLYYADVPISSKGTGAVYALSSGSFLELKGYETDGYTLSSENEVLSFSAAEKLTMHLPSSFLPLGAEDSRGNFTQVLGQQLLLRYDYSQVVQQAQAFQLSESERVVNQSPLVRHLVPHMVRLNLVYSGGEDENQMKKAVEKHIEQISPEEPLEASDVQKILTDKGARYVQNPLDMIALVYGQDRKIRLVKSQDSLTTGRIAAFIPDQIQVKKQDA